jgi:amino acid transporter
MTERKRKSLYWGLKILGILVSCLLPIFSICEKFPIWTESHGAAHSAGVGAVLIAIVLLVVFRRTVFQFIRDKLDLRHAPSIMVWPALLVVAYVMIYIGNFMEDLTTVLWVGFIGSVIGNILTYISNRYSKEKNDGA